MYDYGYYDYGNSYSYDYGYEAASGLATGLLVFAILMWVIGMAISVITIISMWKVFKKANKPGWAAIIPIYNIIVMLEIAELPMWYIALYCIPFANIYAMIKTYIEVAHKFGKSTGFGVGMAFLSPIFLAILAFSKKVNYVGNNNVQTTYQQPAQPTQTVTPVQPVPQQNVQEVTPVQQSVTPVVPVVTPVEPVVEQPVVTQVQPQPVVEQPIQETVQPEINQPATPAFCTNCGSALMPNTKFCTNCGKQI